MITISIPTFRTPPDLLDRAVRSALAQTGVQVRVVVVNDGGGPLDKLPDDDRLIVYDLPNNRGRYFADAVVTRAIADRPDDWWAVLDADDWIAPGHLAQIVPAAIDGAVVSTYVRHQIGRPALTTHPSPRITKPPYRHAFTHLAHWCSGAWTVERVHRAGGIHPGFRVGFDTLYVLMVRLTGDVGVSRVPGYNWCRRDEGSLTTAQETRFGSAHRSRAKAQLVEIYRDAYRSRDTGPGDRLRAQIPYELRKEVERHALKLRPRLR